MSYLANNPQGLKADLTLADGQLDVVHKTRAYSQAPIPGVVLTSGAVFPPGWSAEMVCTRRAGELGPGGLVVYDGAPGAVGNAILSVDKNGNLSVPGAIATSAPASQQGVLDTYSSPAALNNTDAFCMSPVAVPTTSKLATYTKLKVTINWNLANDDMSNNALWEVGVVKQLLPGAGAPVSKATLGTDLVFLGSNTGVTQPTGSGNYAVSSGSLCRILSAGVDYDPALVGGFTAYFSADASFPGTRAVNSTMQLLVEPVF
jgi:hypothetical protein